MAKRLQHCVTQKPPEGVFSLEGHLNTQENSALIQDSDHSPQKKANNPDGPKHVPGALLL